MRSVGGLRLIVRFSRSIEVDQRSSGIGSSPGCHVGTGTLGMGKRSDVLPASLGDAVLGRRRRGCRTVAGPAATGAGISSKGWGRIPTGTVEDRAGLLPRARA